MHRWRSTTLPDRVDLDPPPSADHTTWIVDDRVRRARRHERLALVAPADPAPSGGVRDCFWITRLL